MDRRIIEAKLNQIQSRTIQSRWPVDGWESRTADHLGPGVYAYDGEWAETRLIPESLDSSDGLGHDVALSDDGTRLYVAFEQSDAINVYDWTNRVLLGSISAGSDVPLAGSSSFDIFTSLMVS